MKGRKFIHAISRPFFILSGVAGAINLHVNDADHASSVGVACNRAGRPNDRGYMPYSCSAMNTTHDGFRRVSTSACADRSQPNSDVGDVLKMLFRYSKSRGFTLLELLVVIVIIGLLAAYVGPKYFSQLGRSEVTVAKSQIEAFEKALDTYRLDLGRYPTTEEGLAALLVKPANAAKWNGPYLRKGVPNDPWGRPYQYHAPGTNKEFDLLSYGRGGQPGGTGEDAGISN